MKMTIKQYYETLKAKRESAERELERLKHKYSNNEISYNLYFTERERTMSSINTYTDCICTLEASHLLDDPEETQNKAAAFDVLNKSLDLVLGRELKGFTKDEHAIFESIVVARSDAGDGSDYCRGREITLEERKILKKVGIKE